MPQQAKERNGLRAEQIDFGMSREGLPGHTWREHGRFAANSQHRRPDDHLAVRGYPYSLTWSVVHSVHEQRTVHGSQEELRVAMPEHAVMTGHAGIGEDQVAIIIRAYD